VSTSATAPTTAIPRVVPAAPEVRGHPGADHDQAAWVARARRAATDIDRVRVLARTHEGDPDWAEVDALLDRLGIALGRDHGPPVRLGETSEAR
jgi:hypothetical protein